jgi:outer membrane lipoprotein-sorting protein
MSDNLAALAKQSDLIRWEYENPPEVESVYNGISNVTVNLAGEINV